MALEETLGWLALILQELNKELLLARACSSSESKLKYTENILSFEGLEIFLCIYLRSNPMSRLCQDSENQIALEKSGAV